MMRLGSFLKWPIRLAIAFVMSAGTANAGGDGRIIELNDPAAISEAAAVKAGIDIVVDAAAACRKRSSKTPLECECSSASAMGALRSAYDAAVAHHPEWPQANTTVGWSGTALNFSAIKRALDTCG
jgi:hypothetical protein